MHPMSRNLGIPRFAADSRRGYALVFALVLLVLITMFLIAAQHSAMVSTRLIHRSGARQAAAEAEADLLAAARHQARMGRGAMTVAVTLNPNLATESEALDRETAAETVAPLGERDPIYDRLPAIEHRPGDALVTIVWTELGGATRAERSLINIEGRRRGAIRIPTEG
jgi:hypothetical protein